MAVICAVLATQVRLSTDLTLLLPAHDELASAFEYIRRFGAADTLLVEVDGTSADRQTLERVVDGLGTALADDPRIEHVVYKADVREGQRMREVVAPHAVSLIPAEALADRLSEEGIARTLQTQLHRLAGPGGSFFEASFQQDPLDLTGLAMADIQELGPHRVRTSTGYLLHPHEHPRRAVRHAHALPPRRSAPTPISCPTCSACSTRPSSPSPGWAATAWPTTPPPTCATTSSSAGWSAACCS